MKKQFTLQSVKASIQDTASIFIAKGEKDKNIEKALLAGCCPTILFDGTPQPKLAL